MIPLVDLQSQYRSIRGEIDSAVQRVLINGTFVLGEEVRRFQDDFAAYCGARHGVGVASGTSALQLALLACGVTAGDEVITTPFTFAATAEAICHTGARPVFVDIDPNTYNLQVGRIETAITPRTKVIVPVHLYGQPADMEPLMRVADRNGLRVVEDAAQAHGAEYRGHRVGGLGNVACFSFYPGKNLGAYGDAGIVVTSDAEVADRIMLLRDHGRRGKYEHLILGYGERLDALQAAILRVKLRYLEQWNQCRRAVAAQYRELLADDGIALPAELEGSRHVYHLFVIRVRQRDALLARLRVAGIGAQIHYPLPLHLQPAFAHLGYREDDFPHAEQAAREALSLPMYPELTSDQIAEVAANVRAAVRAGAPNVP